MVVASGFEPPTPTMSRWCSNQLSYATIENQAEYSNAEFELINPLKTLNLRAFEALPLIREKLSLIHAIYVYTR